MKYLVLIVILSIAALLRFWDLQNTPRGLYIDEISLGWNIHLISTTGYDEHGVLLPLAFKAFGEYKLPGYIYATVPVFWLFGPGIWQLRFMSAAAGVIAVLAIYLLMRELKIDTGKNKWVPYLAALLFTIIPWSIHLSRGGFETNLALTTSLFAVYFLLRLRNREEKPKTFPYISLGICLVMFVFSVYTYNAARIILPLLFITTVLIYWNEYRKKTLSILTVLTILLSSIGVIGVVIGGENVRIQQVFELGHTQLELGPFLGTLFKYFDHFSPGFLFFQGDPVGRHSVRELGVLLIPLILFLPIGLYTVCKDIKQKSSLLLIIWLLIAPIPSALATPSPHTLRAIYFLPPLIMIAALGISTVWQWIHQQYLNKRFQRILPIGFASITFISCTYALVTFMHVYFTHWSPQIWPEWSEHHTKAAQYIAKNYPTTARVVMEDTEKTKYYLNFFDAVEGNTIQRDFTGIDHIYKIYADLQTGDVIGIAGWKEAPPQLTDIHEVVAANQNKDVIYKVGVWQAESN